MMQSPFILGKSLLKIPDKNLSNLLNKSKEKEIRNILSLLNCSKIHISRIIFILLF